MRLLLLELRRASSVERRSRGRGERRRRADREQKRDRASSRSDTHTHNTNDPAAAIDHPRPANVRASLAPTEPVTPTRARAPKTQNSLVCLVVLGTRASSERGAPASVHHLCACSLRRPLRPARARRQSLCTGARPRASSRAHASPPTTCLVPARPPRRARAPSSESARRAAPTPCWWPRAPRRRATRERPVRHKRGRETNNRLSLSLCLARALLLPSAAAAADPAASIPAAKHQPEKKNNQKVAPWRPPTSPSSPTFTTTRSATFAWARATPCARTARA